MTDIIFPLDSTKNNLLIVEYDLNIDNTASIYNAVGSSKTAFMSKFLKTSYTNNGNTYLTTLAPRSNQYIENVIFSDISKSLQNMEDINVVISTRNENYIFNIK